MIASTTKSLSLTASALFNQYPFTSNDASIKGQRTYASVVVVILAMMFFVNPSISFGLAFFATLDRDLVMMFKPFLLVSIDVFRISGTGAVGCKRGGLKWTYWRA
jgi:hypothetical protein